MREWEKLVAEGEFQGVPELLRKDRLDSVTVAVQDPDKYLLFSSSGNWVQRPPVLQLLAGEDTPFTVLDKAQLTKPLSQPVPPYSKSEYDLAKLLERQVADRFSDAALLSFKVELGDFDALVTMRSREVHIQRANHERGGGGTVELPLVNSLTPESSGLQFEEDDLVLYFEAVFTPALGYGKTLEEKRLEGLRNNPPPTVEFLARYAPKPGNSDGSGYHPAGGSGGRGYQGGW